MTFLETILEHKGAEVAQRKTDRPIGTLLSSRWYGRSTISLKAALLKASPAIIAELKKASPSRGIIRHDFRPADFARAYEAAGAAAISVLTDERFFSGSLQNLEDAREVVSIPLLRKDFVVDEYQLHEARAHGADAVLLIVAALSAPLLQSLLECAGRIGLDALVEVHTVGEVETALRAGAKLLGINNRDLHSFNVDLRTTEDILPHVPPTVTLVSESGIGSADQILRLTRSGVSAFLLGESLMRSDDPGAALADLLSSVRERMK